MTGAPFKVVPLDVSAHICDEFDGDSPPLNRYLREQATQDMRRRVSACFVAIDPRQRIVGYYTLASHGVLLDTLPEQIRKKLPRYPTVPAVRMSRLAIDREFTRIGLGGALLADAFARIIRAEIAAYALVVDAKDEQALSFYKHHGFIAFPDLPLTLFYPVGAVRNLV